MSAASAQVFADVSARLAERVAEARALAAAIVAGDTEAAESAHARLARGEVAAILAPLQRHAAADPRALTAEIVAAIRQLSGDVRAADAAVAAALTDAAAASVPLWLLGRGRVTAAAVEGVLAEPWNRNRDLLVLVGDGAWAAGEALRARGQSRVLVIDRARPETAREHEGLEPVLWNAHTRESIELSLTLLGWPLPAQVRIVQAGERPLMSLPELQQVVQAALEFAGIGHLQILEEARFFALKASRNLAALASTPTADRVRGALAGWTAVVVAAGPSLDKNLHLLKELQGRVVIIAINQTVRGLRKHGIHADIVVTVDPLNVSYHFEGTQPGDIGALFLGASVEPALFKLPCDRIVNFSASPLCEQWIYDLMGEEANVGSAGTVATGAIKLAAWLGCTTVISIGRDLALAGEQYYAASSADGGHNIGRTEDGRITFAGYGSKLRLAEGGNKEAVQAMLANQVYQLKEVRGFYGTPVKTTNLFIHELEQLRRAVAAHKAAGMRFINATEGGAWLEGMEHMSLAEAGAGVVAPGSDSPAACLARALPPARDRAREARIAAEYEALAQDLRRITELAREAQRLTAQDGGEARRRRKQVAADLAARSRARPFLSILVQHATRAIVKKDAPSLATLDEVAEAERQLYTAIGDVAESLTPGLEAAVGELRSGG